MPTEISQAILSAITYFDIFDYPLTSFEIEKWLYANNTRMSANQTRIRQVLETELAGPISFDRGFYFLKGREQIVQTRLDRYNLADKKFKRALLAGKLLAALPFVRMIAVCNSLGYGNASDQSDIDFFISQDSLDLEKIALEDDIYLIYWLSQLTPIYNQDQTYQQLLRSNFWINDYLPKFLEVSPNPRRHIKQSLFFARLKDKLENWLSGNFGGRLENYLKNYQFKILPPQLKALAHSAGTDVIINDKMLKFHDKDNRVKYRETFKLQLGRVLENAKIINSKL